MQDAANGKKLLPCSTPPPLQDEAPIPGQLEVAASCRALLPRRGGEQQAKRVPALHGPLSSAFRSTLFSSSIVQNDRRTDRARLGEEAAPSIVGV